MHFSHGSLLRLFSHVVVAALITFSIGCKKPLTQSVVETIPAGDVRADTGFYSVVFYYQPDPATDPRVLTEQLAKQFLPEVPFTTDADSHPAPPYIGFEEEMAPLKKFPVPDTEYFDHAGRGLTAGDIENMQKTSKATRLVLVMPKQNVWAMGQKFSELALEFARQANAFIWDSATRECFTQAAWRERLDAWPDGSVPQISKHITIHLYRPEEDSDYLRAITLGMEKFALPDIVIEQLIRGDSRSGGNLINFVGQALAERPNLASGAREVFRVAEITTASAREKLSQNLKSGATLEVTLALVPGERKPGDPHNRLVELDFRHGEGNTVDEKRQALLSAIWGASDSLKTIQHTPEVLAASARTKAKLPNLQRTFADGLPPGSNLMLKAPFKTNSGGSEWMWVEVLRWPKGGPIDGILQNDPFEIKALKAGARVRVKQSEVFDYMLHRKDGTTEGNETGGLIEKLNGTVQEK